MATTPSAGAAPAFAAAAGLDLPAGVVFRHVRRPDDYHEMNRVANAMREAIGEAFTTSDEQFASYYETADRFAVERDVAVVERDGAIVGYVRCGRNAEVSGLIVYELMPFIDPSIDPDPIYPLMLAAIERHARGLAADDASDKVLETFGGDKAPGLERHVLAAGFEPIRHGYSMVRPHLDDLPDAELPEGLEIREVRPEDVRQIYDAAVEAFNDAWGATEQTDGDWERFIADPIETQTHLWRVAWDGDQVAGQVRSFINEDENNRFGRKRGYTESISVRRPYRRRGLARALIAASFVKLREHGMTEAALAVDTENVTGALRVYEGCGFVPVARTTTYRKPF